MGDPTHIVQLIRIMIKLTEVWRLLISVHVFMFSSAFSYDSSELEADAD